MFSSLRLWVDGGFCSVAITSLIIYNDLSLCNQLNDPLIASHIICYSKKQQCIWAALLLIMANMILFFAQHCTSPWKFVPPKKLLGSDAAAA
jgi:hypothetical protein